MDAISLLKNDHRTVEELFKRFERAGDRALPQKREIVDRIIEELSVHAVIEEQVLYPVARATVPRAEDMVLESLEEHHIVKWVLSELEGMDPTDERFGAKVTVLIENVRHHVKEEEGDFFPMVRRSLNRSALEDLGEALDMAKQSASTHPHPRSPDAPPGNLVVGAISGVVDRVGDNIEGLRQGGMAAVQDLIARILGGRPAGAPTGSSVTRSRANDVRRTASNAADGVARTAGSVRSGAAATARAAKAGAKSTASTAKKSARATGSTAKRAATTTGRTAKKPAGTTKATAKRAAATTAKRSTATRSTAKPSTTKRSTAKRSTAKRSTKKSAASARGSRS